MKKITAVLLAIISVISIMTASAFAASEAKAEVPVKLTVVNNYKKVSVTVPASLPIEIYNGSVITASNAKITNNSESTSVKITSITVKKGSMDIGDYNSFTGKNTIALKINDVPSVKEGKMTINDKAFPDISAKGSLPLTYYAKVSGDVSSMANTDVASIVFTISVVD